MSTPHSSSPSHRGKPSFLAAQDEDAPLLLSQVLEEEYQALHGPLPDTYFNAKQTILANATNERELNEQLVSALYSHIRLQQQTALCLSGGGIRSATFGLGVLQGLARHDLLEPFRYLSTVSGGGYVGSWLTSWIHCKGLRTVAAELKNPPTSKLNPEPKPIRHLRDYSNYLTPQLGWLSADTWTLIATYLRNLFVNWFVWLPLLIAVLITPRLLVAASAHNPGAQQWQVGLALLAGFALVVCAQAYICLNLPSVRESIGQAPHPFRTRDMQKSFLTWCLLPLLLSAFLLATGWAWLRNSGESLVTEFAFMPHVPTWAPFVLAGTLIHVAGWLAAMALLLRFGAGELRAGLLAMKNFRLAYHNSEMLSILLSGAVGGLATWIVAADIFPNPGLQFATYACFSVPLLLFSFLIAGAVYVGLASHWTSDDDREWWARSSAWILIALVAWSGICAS